MPPKASPPDLTKIKILHLSDLHFGSKDGKSKHHFVRKTAPDPDGLVQVLLADPELQSAPDLAVVSGDLVWSGTEEDYGIAAAFLNRLQTQWKSTEFVLAPGNHDVNWGRSGSGEHPQQDYLTFLQKFYAGSFSSYYRFWTSADQVPERPWTQLVGLHHRPGAFLAVSVNSAAFLKLPPDRREDIPVFVSPSVLDRIGKSLPKRGKDGELRLLVLHHHLMPFAENPVSGHDPETPIGRQDPSIVENSARLQTWLARNGFHVVLHGHKHVPHGREDRLWRAGDPGAGRQLLVVGAGSAGVVQDERGTEGLSYNVIHGTPGSSRWCEVRVDVRKIAKDSMLEEASRSHVYAAVVGERPPEEPRVFCSERIDLCHRMITAAWENSHDGSGSVPWRNFMVPWMTKRISSPSCW